MAPERSGPYRYGRDHILPYEYGTVWHRPRSPNPIERVMGRRPAPGPASGSDPVPREPLPRAPAYGALDPPRRAPDGAEGGWRADHAHGSLFPVLPRSRPEGASRAFRPGEGVPVRDGNKPGVSLADLLKYYVKLVLLCYEAITGYPGISCHPVPYS